MQNRAPQPNSQPQPLPQLGAPSPYVPNSNGYAHHARYGRLIHDLRPGEIVLALARRHQSVLLTQLGIPLLALCLWAAGLFFVLPFVAGLQTDPLLSGNFGGPTAPQWAPPLLSASYLAVAGLILLWALYLVFDWKDDWLALTNLRVILMDKTLFFHETRREVPVQKVQNIVAEYPRVLSMALDFGDLEIDTAGVGLLIFKDLPHPRAFREAIFAQQAMHNASQPPPDDLRKAALRNLLAGADPKAHQRLTPPNGYPRIAGRGATQMLDESQISGYGIFNRLLPFASQRAAGGVTWHKHWAYLLRGLLWPFVVYAVALGGWFALRVSGVLTGLGAFSLSGLDLSGILGWTSVALLPLCLLWALWIWEDWRNDLYRLDKERVYHIEALPFGLREVSTETLIGRITDVSYTVPGLLANLLNYGNVVIKTPGESTEFLFTGIPAPRRVQSEIMARIEEHRQKGDAGLDREIESWIKAYDDVRRGK